jgi:hypothetical protein
MIASLETVLLYVHLYVVGLAILQLPRRLRTARLSTSVVFIFLSVSFPFHHFCLALLYSFTEANPMIILYYFLFPAQRLCQLYVLLRPGQFSMDIPVHQHRQFNMQSSSHWFLIIRIDRFILSSAPCTCNNVLD